MSKVYVFLADGFEEIEGLTVVDLLLAGRRRGGDSIYHGKKNDRRFS